MSCGRTTAHQPHLVVVGSAEVASPGRGPAMKVDMTQTATMPAGILGIESGWTSCKLCTSQTIHSRVASSIKSHDVFTPVLWLVSQAICMARSGMAASSIWRQIGIGRRNMAKPAALRSTVACRSDSACVAFVARPTSIARVRTSFFMTFSSVLPSVVAASRGTLLEAPRPNQRIGLWQRDASSVRRRCCHQQRSDTG
jgi:hypothetical protein